MKLSTLQTTEAPGLLNNTMYKGIAFKFDSLFTHKGRIQGPTVPLSVIKEGSQFYKTLVELAWKGTRARATVLYVNETGLLVNNDPVISLTLCFHDAKKTMQEITAKTIVPKISMPKVAENIMIAYNEKDLAMVAVL